MEEQTLSLSQRTVTGKKVKQLRRQGILPVHMYGRGIDSMSLQGVAGDLRRLLPRIGTNIPVSVQVEGNEGENVCFVRDVQRHPVTEDLLHIDFIRVDVTQTISAEVPIALIGSAPATQQGGTLLQPLTSLLVEALPMNIPATVEADVSGLDDFEKSIIVRDIPIADNVTVLTDRDEFVARVIPPRVETETFDVSDEELDEEATEEEEGAEE
ncbi:50S ribosomal protein L25 [Geodia barretti]|uniref:50S ribosomal protein L25 n=1 Tax=Geodia barretti TaxID=519541 RepID=A0AA35VUN9_GEOBA|nr:50S ribosomal protein L25 [Geodia barretti]